MNILVCVKQVPDTTEIKIDPVKHTLIREGVPSIVNPFDACALELAVRLKEKEGGNVYVVSMGPAQAKNALKECLSVGADQAFLVTDRAFGGSDTLATSYILSRAIGAIEKKTGGKIDVIFAESRPSTVTPRRLGRRSRNIWICPMRPWRLPWRCGMGNFALRLTRMKDMTF